MHQTQRSITFHSFAHFRRDRNNATTTMMAIITQESIHTIIIMGLCSSINCPQLFSVVVFSSSDSLYCPCKFIVLVLVLVLVLFVVLLLLVLLLVVLVVVVVVVVVGVASLSLQHIQQQHLGRKFR